MATRADHVGDHRMMFTPMDVEVARADPGGERSSYRDSANTNASSFSRRHLVVALAVGLSCIVAAGLLIGMGMAKPASGEEADTLDIFVFGDWGRRGVPEQLAVAAALKSMASPILAAIVSTGDQFYERGVTAPTSAQDDQWDASWHDIYFGTGSPLVGKPFIGSLGNHDLLESVGAQTSHSAQVANSDEWVMPARYFEQKTCLPGSPGASQQHQRTNQSLDADTGRLLGEQPATGQGCICMAVVDTTCLLAAMRNETAPSAAGRKGNCASLDRLSMRLWLNTTLTGFVSMQCTRTIVIGHHPMISGGEHGDNPEVSAALLPGMAGRVDAYVSGHDHMQQVSRVPGVGRPIQLVSGAGSTVRNDTVPTPSSVFTSLKPGFLRLRLRRLQPASWDRAALELDIDMFETPVGTVPPAGDAKAAFTMAI